MLYFSAKTMPNWHKPRRREKSAAPDQGATLFQYGHLHFSISSCAVQSDKVALWICTLAGTLTAPGAAHSRLGNCTKTRRELQECHGEPQRTTEQRRGTTQRQPGTVENCTATPGNCADAAEKPRKEVNRLPYSDGLLMASAVT